VTHRNRDGGESERTTTTEDENAENEENEKRPTLLKRMLLPVRGGGRLQMEQANLKTKRKKKKGRAGVSRRDKNCGERSARRKDSSPGTARVYVGPYKQPED